MADLPLIQKHLPEYRKQLRNKYGNLDLTGIPLDVVRQAIRTDVDRLNSGRRPLSGPETLYGLRAVAEGKPQVPVPEERSASLWSIPGNVFRDVADVAKALPRLPEAIKEEGRQVAALASGEDVELADENVVAKVLSMPGVRLLPGAYVGEQLARGEPSELVRHPGFAALDVLPLKGLGKTKPALKAKAVLAETAPGRTAIAAKQAMVASGPGQWLSTRLLGQARELVRTQMDLTQRLERFPNLKGGDLEMLAKGDPELLAAGTLARDIAKEAAGSWEKLAPERRVAITEAVTKPKQPGDPYADLLPEERAIAPKIAEFNRRSGGLLQQQEQLFLEGGEYYTEPQQRSLRRYQRAADKANDLAVQNRDFLTETLGPHADHPKIARFLDDLDANPRRAMAMSRAWVDRPTAQRRPALPEGINWRRVHQAAKEYSKKTRQVGKFEQGREAVVPGRWRPLIEEQFAGALKGKMRERVSRVGVTDDIAQAEQLIDAGLYEMVTKADGTPLFSRAEVGRQYRDIAGGWKAMKDAGYDPVFMHRVGPGGEKALAYPHRVAERIRKPSMAKDRTMDVSPGMQDFSVAMRHAAMEHLGVLGDQRFVQAILENKMFGAVRQSEVKSQLLETARAIAARRPVDDVRTVLDELISKRYREFHPEQFVGLRRAGVGRFGGDTWLLPRHLADALDNLKKRYDTGLVGAYDGLTGLFRTSVLAMSPRWQATNLIGGTILTAISQPEALWHVFAAHRLLKTGKMPVELGTSVSREIRRWNFQAGQTADRLFRQGAASRMNDVPYDKIVRTVDKTVHPFRVVANKMYDWNAYVDDLFRTMNFLGGQKRALRMVKREGGLMDYQMPAKVRERLKAARAGDNEAKLAFAEEEGIRLGRQVLQTFDDLTPIERNVIRFFIPFYSWQRQIVRFAYNLSVDHPFRVQVTSQLLRRELEDWESGLPLDFITFFRPPWAKEDPDTGMVSMVDTRSFNPFAGFGDYFSLSGLVQQTNPLISTPLERLGIDPMSGEAEQFSDLEYDPETGRMRRVSLNPLEWGGSFVKNLVPQVGAVAQLAGLDPEARRLAMANPEAAGRMLWGRAGLPQYFKEYSPVRKTLETEASRLRAFQQAQSAALREGQWGRFEQQYPGPATRLQQKLRGLQDTGALAPYTLTEGQHALSLAQNTLKAQIGR